MFLLAVNRSDRVLEKLSWFTMIEHTALQSSISCNEWPHNGIKCTDYFPEEKTPTSNRKQVYSV